MFPLETLQAMNQIKEARRSFLKNLLSETARFMYHYPVRLEPARPPETDRGGYLGFLKRRSGVLDVLIVASVL